MMRGPLHLVGLLAAGAIVTAGVVTTAGGQANPGRPEELVGADIVENLDAKLPLDLVFTDDEGNDVRLGDYFGGDKPVVITLGYYRCPQLCNFVFNGLVDTLKKTDWTVGNEFQWINVSINPLEGPELAAAKKANYIVELARPGAGLGVHFLVGDEDSITSLAETIGYGYRFDPRSGEYAHSAGVFVITPDGRVSRYLYGIQYEPRDFRLALLEASEGRIGTTIDRIMLWCYHYDPDRGSYALFARRLMQLGGAATITLLAGGFGLMWWRDAHSKFKQQPATAEQQ